MATDSNEAPQCTDRCYPALTRRAILQGIGAAGLSTILTGHSALAAEAHATNRRRLKVVAKDYAFELPGSVPCGYTEITLYNEGSEEHHAMFMRLNPGTTVAEFMNAAKHEDLPALFAISSSAGGPGSIDHGKASTVIMDLTPGEYMVICIVPDAQGMAHYKMGMLAPLTVTGVAKAESTPRADLTIDLLDFSFSNLPRQIKAGKHLWKVVNTSPQLHEMILSRLARGISFNQAKAILMAPPPSAKAPVPSVPFVAVAGAAPMSPGAINWAMLDLQAGDYFAVCFVPDTKTGKPHFELGMIAPVTVGL
ncbi:MAG TPA: hypothetical protein VF285_11735 [Castellaniella sp.]|uniref:hypothetical protein n=1 Tax=Castellaniella sp. TaxID=1955812 RepID=UPI002F20B153